MHLFHFALQYILVYFHKMRYYGYIRNYFSYRRSILVGCFPLWDHMRNGSSFNIYETRLLPGFSLLFLVATELATSSFLIFYNAKRPLCYNVAKWAFFLFRISSGNPRQFNYRVVHPSFSSNHSILFTANFSFPATILWRIIYPFSDIFLSRSSPGVQIGSACGETGET